MDKNLTGRLVAEAVGTFAFFTIGFTGILAALAFGLPGPGVAAAFGFGLAAAIFMFGHISGGHFNPAVTLGLAVGKQFAWKDVVPYWIAQLLGGVVAAGLVRVAFDSIWEQVEGGADNLINGFQLLPDGATVGTGATLAAEIIATALFVMLIMGVATDERAPWNGIFAPLAIGGFIFLAALTFGSLTSGSFNSARSIAPALLSGEFEDLWVYVVGPLVGGAIGGAVYAGVRQLSADS